MLLIFLNNISLPTRNKKIRRIRKQNKKRQENLKRANGGAKASDKDIEKDESLVF